MLEIEEKVNHLDELMAQLIQTVNQTSREMREFKQESRLSRERSEREMQAFKEEMRLAHERAEERSKHEMQEFREEMRLAHERAEERSKREMQEFREEMRLAHERAEERSKHEMQEFKEEMRLAHERAEERSKREMQEFKEEMRLAHERADERFEREMRQLKKEWNIKWGDLSRKLGTIAEDMVAPSIPRILRQVAGCVQEIKYSAVRVRKSEPRNQEFDVVAVCDNYVFINETKSTLRSEHISHFHELMQKIHDYFPEFEGKQFIGAIASLYVDQSLINYGERLGFIMLGLGEELMDVLNSPGFVPKQF